jgi:hypothetical protein
MSCELFKIRFSTLLDSGKTTKLTKSFANFTLVGKNAVQDTDTRVSNLVLTTVATCLLKVVTNTPEQTHAPSLQFATSLSQKYFSLFY